MLGSGWSAHARPAPGDATRPATASPTCTPATPRAGCWFYRGCVGGGLGRRRCRRHRLVGHDGDGRPGRQPRRRLGPLRAATPTAGSGLLPRERRGWPRREALQVGIRLERHDRAWSRRGTSPGTACPTCSPATAPADCGSTPATAAAASCRVQVIGSRLGWPDRRRGPGRPHRRPGRRPGGGARPTARSTTPAPAAVPSVPASTSAPPGPGWPSSAERPPHPPS